MFPYHRLLHVIASWTAVSWTVSAAPPLRDYIFGSHPPADYALIQAMDLPSAGAVFPSDLNDDRLRIGFVGNTWVHRESELGIIEFELTRLFPNREIVFRNLGWPGDTIAGEIKLELAEAWEEERCVSPPSWLVLPPYNFGIALRHCMYPRIIVLTVDDRFESHQVWRCLNAVRQRDLPASPLRKPWMKLRNSTNDIVPLLSVSICFHNRSKSFTV